MVYGRDYKHTDIHSPGYSDPRDVKDPLWADTEDIPGSLTRWNLIHTWRRIDAASFFDKKLFAHRWVYKYDRHCTGNSSLIDIFVNMTGTTLGIATDRAYNLFLDYRAERLQMRLYDRTE